jgi:hypothetical protein
VAQFAASLRRSEGRFGGKPTHHPSSATSPGETTDVDSHLVSGRLLVTTLAPFTTSKDARTLVPGALTRQ